MPFLPDSEPAVGRFVADSSEESTLDTVKKGLGKVKDYGLAIVSGSGEGVASTLAGAGTFVQAPAANTLSGVLSARALADRGITAALNYVAPGSAELNPEYQQSAQQASAFAAERRDENLGSSRVARAGHAVQEYWRQGVKDIQAFNQEYNPELVRQQQAQGSAEGFVDSLKAISENPMAFTHTLARSAPDMAAGAGVAKGVAAGIAARGGAAASQVAGASTAGILAESVSSANQAREMVYQQVADMTIERLAASPRYREILQSVGDPMKAREALANELADQAPLLAGTGTALGSVITNKLFGGDTSAKMIAGAERTTGKAVAKNVAQEGIEEGLQGVPEDLAQHGAMVQADPSKKFDLGKTLAENMAAGLAMGAGGSSMAYARDNWKRSGDDAAPAGSPDNAVPADQALGGQEYSQFANSEHTKQTEAEKALYTPASLTALDRVAEIDREISAATPERVAELQVERENITKNWPKSTIGAPASFTTEAGARIDGQYALMEAGDLITSHDENLRQSPLYPQELQPRERDRAASEMQVSGIVQKLDPARLGLSADAATGAPIVGADGLVESGNARTIALKRVYQANGLKADDYKQFLRANAQQFGITPESVDAMQKPVLVRVRNTPVNRAEFARQANASTVAQMSPSEQAKSDAARMDVMDDLRPDENGDFNTSRDFIRRFMAKLPATEQSGMIDAAGNLSQTGYARIRNAVLAKAYGDSPVLTRMVESMDDQLRNVGKALMQAAPEVAKLRQDVAEGALFDADITPDLLAAVEELSKLRESGRSVHDALAQAGMFGDKYSPETRDLLTFLDENIRRPRVMAEFILRYTEALRAAGNPNQGSIFGDATAPTKGQLLTAAKGNENAAAEDGKDEGTGGQGASQPADARGGEGRAQGDEGAASEWVRFPAETGTLGIPRSEMPQVKGEHRGALIQFLDGRDITHETIEALPADDLKPTQAEFSTKKTETWKDVREGVDRSVLASSDGYILDGHHQWVAALATGEPVKVIRFSAPIRELLATVHQFPSVKRSEGHASDPKRAKAREDFQAAMADLGAVLRDFANVARMVPENTPDFLPTLVKLSEATIKLVGYNIRDVVAAVKKAAKADATLKTVWNKITDEIYRKAAKQAVDNLFANPEQSFGQGDLFGQPAKQEAAKGQTGDLFSAMAAAAPDVFGEPKRRTWDERRKDNFVAPPLKDVVPLDVFERVHALVEKWKDNLPEDKISAADRAKAESMLAPVIEAAARDEAWFDERVREIGKQFAGSQLGPTKKIGRAAVKLVQENFDLSEMKDIVRATIVVSSFDAAQNAVEAIAGKFKVIQINNKSDLNISAPEGARLNNKGILLEGYKDVTAFVRLPGGGIAEIQINTPVGLSGKDAGHVLYEGSRVVKDDPNRQGDYVELRDGQIDLYFAAYASNWRATEMNAASDSEPWSEPAGNDLRGFNIPDSSSSLNTLPSGNSTQSPSERSTWNEQPSGNLSGTGIISSTSNDSIANAGSAAYTETGKYASGVANEQHGESGSGGAEGKGAGPAQGSASGRKAGRVRAGAGRGNAGADRVDDAGAAGQGEMGPAGTDGVRGKDETGGRAKPRDRVQRNAGIPAGRDIPVKSGRNYSFGDEDLTYAGSWQVKARQNVEAVELLKRLEKDGRQATPEEQKTLAKFIGWGASEIANSIFGDKLDKQLAAISNYEDAIGWMDEYKRDSMQRSQGRHYAAFQVLQAKNQDQGASFYDPKYATITREQLEAAKPDMSAKKWAELRDRLKAVMTKEEWQSASRSTQNAHYTSKPIVQSMMRMIQRMGFHGGAIMEPGAGIGVFPGLMPESMAINSVYTGIEMDPVTGGILKQLMPDERILVESFVDSKLPTNYYDVAFGNPPFAAIPILADPKYKKNAFLLHDYFFAKTIDSVKPGGLVVFVTSNGTMDKRGDKARTYLAERADLVGAVRLPQTAFKKNAGTEVVTDVLVLRKKVDGETFEHGQDWLKSVPLKVGDKEFTINEYFVNHPEMVLGEHSSQGSMYAADSYTVIPKEGDIDALFDAATASLPADIYKAGRGSSAEAAKVREIDFNPKAQKEGNYYVTDAGALMVREGGVGVRAEGVKEKDKPLLKGFVSLRDALKQAHYDQLNDGDWEPSLKALQKEYASFVKKFGQINQNTSYVQRVKVDVLDEEGTPTGEKEWDVEPRFRFPLLSKINDDPDWTLVAALENVVEADGEITISEGAFLTERVLGKPAPMEAKTPTDALLQVLNDTGEVSIEAIAGRLGMDEQDMIEALGPLVYQDPSSGWVTADDYLSGDVRKKLKAAQEAAKSDRNYQRNVEALISVQPTPKTHSEITPQIGMPWIPTDIYEQFLRDKADIDVTVNYNERTGQWHVGIDDSSYTKSYADRRSKRKGELSDAATKDWGTDRRNAAEILEYALTGSPVKIMMKVDDGKTVKDVFDSVATEAVTEKLNKMREEFKSWLWEDQARVEKLVPIYNDKFNTIVPRKFDGSHMTLPGASKRWSVFDHVKRGAWRIIQSGNTYLAHAVGSGKTFQMIISAMEQKRLGMVKKPMMVVPNHMLQQFAREWQDLYPAARLMVADENNFTGDNRRRFVSRVAMTDLDGVIITQSAFKLLDLDPKFKEQMIERELDFLRAAYKELGEDPAAITFEETTNKKGEVSLKMNKSGSRDPKVKQIETRIERMEQKLRSAMSSEGKDANVRFDEMGVDMLYVDEAHEYRKLAYTTQRQVKGIDSNGSDKAFDLFMKVQWLRENKNPKRNLVMASGTPVTNTMAELYSVQKFMAPQVLEERGLEEFDQWASMFGAESTTIEPDAAGKYGPVTRFNKFVNVAELTQMFREFADVLTADYLASLLGDKRPKVKGGSRKVAITPKTEAYTSFQKEELQPRMEASRNWKPSHDEPNNPDPVIRIIGDGRLAAIDMRFMDPSQASDPDSKLNKMVDEVVRIYKETADWEYKGKDGKPESAKGAAQIVFSDLGFGEGVAKNRGFNARAWFEKRLRDAGVAPAHVAFMSDNKKSIAKLKLFKDINAGRVRIVVGSSKNMGTGVNAQQRLIALHHLDAPWYPADLEQREGRIVRQGNKNSEVQLYAYAAKGSYDEQMWSTLARKQFFIDQALSGDPNIREIEDMGESSQFEIAAGMVADDPRVLQLAGLRAEIDKLGRLYRAHEDQRGKMQRDFDLAGSRIASAERGLAATEAEAAKVQDLTGDNFKAKADGKTFDTRKEWGEALLAKFKDLSDHLVEKDTVIGQISGFDVVYRGFGKDQKRFMSEIAVTASDDIILAQDTSSNAAGVAMRATSGLVALTRKPAELRQIITESKAKRDSLAPRLNAEFPLKQMLLDKESEARSLEGAIMGVAEAAGLKREQELEDAWAAKTGAITPLFSRGTGSGMAFRDLKAVVSRVSKGFKNLPTVHVLESPDQAPKALREYIEQAGAMETVEGATHEGEIYLFASGLADEARAEHVLATHEITHYGLRGAVGKGLDAALQHVWLNNANVRRQATALRDQYGLASNVEAVEEVLADMKTGDLAKLTGWRRVVKAVRDWLQKAGATNLAGRLDDWLTKGMDDQQRADLFVADLLNAARAWVKNGKKPASAFAMDDTRLAGSLEADVAEQEKWLTREAKMRGYNDIEDLLARNYPLFEKLAELWRKKHPADEGVLLSRNLRNSSQGAARVKTLDDVRKAWDDAGIENWIHEKGGIITLSQIVVPKDGRNKGAGTKAMQELFAYADQTSQQIALTPSSDFGGNKSRLEKWYRGLGFRTYKGYVIREKLIRDHQQTEIGPDARPAGYATAAPTQSAASLSRDGLGAGPVASGDTVPSLDRATRRDSTERGSPAGADDGSKVPRLSRNVNAPSVSDRADAIIAKSAATRRPIDAIARTLTQAVRLDSLTRKLYDKAGNLLNRYTPEQVKAGVVADYGVPEAVLDRRTEMVGKQKQMMRKSGVLIEKLATLTREESRVAYEWMNNASPEAATYFEAQLPPESVKILADVKRLIDELSKEAVRLGQLSPEAFERNRFEYLHRSYLKHTMELTKGETESRRRSIAVLGDQYKGRGMSDAVDMAKFKNVAPEWWGRKLAAGKADANLKGEKFIRLERRQPVGEGTLPLQENAGPGEANPLRKGKLLEVAYWPAGEKIPAKFSTWDQSGTWEVRDTKGGKLVVWRDFTKAERTAMGEIDEARYAIAKTLHGMIHDVETGRYLEWLAQRHAKKDGEVLDGELVDASESMRQSFPPGTWVKVPETKIPGTSTLKYGTLAGRYLPGPIWNDVRQTVGFRFKPFGETFAAIMSAWKTAKTALSPAVHLNNVMANMVMADWHDVSAGHMVKALRILLAAHERDGTGALGRVGNVAARGGIADREAAAEVLARFNESGGNLGTWATTELQKEQLEPLLKALENELGLAGDTPASQVGAMVALQKLLQLKLPSAWDAFKPTKAGQALTTEARSLISMYEAEDQVFRLASWLKAKEEGAGDLAAGKVARRSFLDYHINAPWVQAARGTVFPFIAFTYRAVPMMLETAANKPWKLMKLAALAGGLNALGYLLSGGDEDDERKLLPEEKAGRVWGLVPKLIRMPWNDINSNPVFLDVRRFIPVGDIFDTGQSHSALPMIPAMVPGGPAALIAELVLNRQQFTGKGITLETDTATEKAAKIADYLYKAFAPNLVILPGTYAYSGVVNAAKGRTDTFGREQSTAQAMASAFGVKLGSYPKDVLQLNAQREAQAKTMEIDRNITALKREYQKHGITADEFQREIGKQQEKKRKVQDELNRRMNGGE